MITEYLFKQPYETEFIYDNDKVYFDINDTKLKKQFILSSDYSSDLNLEYNLNKSLIPIAIADVAASGNWAVFTKTMHGYIDYEFDGNNIIQIGTVKFKYKPNYSGIPSSTASMFSIFNVSGDKTNRIGLHHMTNGAFRFAVNSYDNQNSLLLDTSIWNVTSGQEYEIEIDFNFTAGNVYLFIDGSLFYNNSSAVITRNGNATTARVGNNHGISGISNFDITDFQIFDKVLHTENFIIGKYTLYTKEVQTIVRADTFRTDEMQEIESNLTEVTGEAEIRRILNKDGQDIWYNTVTGQMENSDGTWDQANTLAEFQTYFIGETTPGNDKIKILFKSYNGDKTPSIENLKLTYSYSAEDINKEYADIEQDTVQNPEDTSNNVDLTWQLINPEGTYKNTPINKFIGRFTYDSNTNRISESLLKTEDMPSGSHYIFSWTDNGKTYRLRKIIPNSITGSTIDNLPDYEGL